MVGCKISSGNFFFLSRGFFFFFNFYGPQVDPFFSLLFLFAWRMVRGHEEVSTSYVERRRGTP